MAPLRVGVLRRCSRFHVDRKDTRSGPRHLGRHHNPRRHAAGRRASYRRIFERVAGTFAGVLAAWVITMLFHSAAIICIFILVVAPLIPHHLAHRYWLHTGLIALTVLLAYDLTLLDTHSITNLLSERLEDILLGCAMGLVGTAVAFPREAAAGLDELDRRKPQGSMTRRARYGAARASC